jgi:hypothetical protein
LVVLETVRLPPPLIVYKTTDQPAVVTLPQPGSASLLLTSYLCFYICSALIGRNEVIVVIRQRANREIAHDVDDAFKDFDMIVTKL